MIDDLVEKRLLANAQGGSKPRCNRITQGSREVVASRLTSLISDWGTVSEADTWMPLGFEDTTEAQLDKHQFFKDKDIKKVLKEWWFARSNRSHSPNFDIVSTCMIGNVQGILLVEAKAHVAELTKEKGGKVLSKSASANSLKNHAKIGKSIAEANVGLHNQTSLSWGLSRDSHYQMSNRFAWSWKLLQLGVPVILVYMGFLEAYEMGSGAGKKRNQKVLIDHQMWRNLVYDHSSAVVPKEAWEAELCIYGKSFIPLIRSVKIAFNEPIEDFCVEK